jgi:2-iminobutanoate/2-iminopropanoate deaminase
MRNLIKVLTFIAIIALFKAEGECDVTIDSLDAPNTPAAIGPYSKLTRVNLGETDMIFFSGQIGLNPKTGDLVSDDISDQTNQVLTNIKALLEGNGSSLNNVSKTTILLADMNDFNTVNTIYAKYFTQTLPARSTYSVKGLPKNAKVEIEGIAFGKQECRTKSELDFLSK